MLLRTFPNYQQLENNVNKAIEKVKLEIIRIILNTLII